MKKFLTILLFIPLFASARKFYVSSAGSDSYTTTQAQNPLTPWQTLSKVQSNVANGDSVLFAKDSKFSGTLTLSNKSNIYFGVYGTGADPLFWGTNSTVSVLITLNGCTNLTFYGWKISDTTISATDRYIQAKIQNVFATYQGCTGIVIRKCTMDRTGYGVYFPPGNNNNTVDSCDIGNLRMIRNTPTSVNPDDDYGGVPVQLSSSNNIVTNNYFHDCYAASYDYTFDGGGVEFFEEGSVIENNVIAYNTFYDCNGIFEFGSNNDGVANNLIQNNKIYYNKIINNNTVVYISNSGQYKTAVRNLQFYNNVMLQTVPNTNPGGSSGIMFSMSTSEATAGIIILKNNIIQVSNGLSLTRNGQLNGANLSHTNNIYKLSNGSVTNFTLDGTEISTSGIIWTNTTNSNPLNWDYTLTSTSPAINSGVNVGLTSDFVGNSVGAIPSMGIYQYGGSVTPTPCTFTYGSWTTCSNGTQTRPYTPTPTGCIGVPPTDSIQRSCTTPIVPCTFTYGTWTTCSNGIQTRPFTSSPTNCTGVPPADSLTRTCASPTTRGRKFYFSSIGNDSYSVTQAQNPLTPWKTLAKLNTLSSIATAGDTFAFKRGEIFANGTEFSTVASVKWYGGGYEGLSFPSGTATNPIVFTYYGDINLESPNLLYPYPSSVRSNEKGVLAFANVSYIVIDGIQFNDTRFPVNDKRSGAFTTLGLWFGDSGYCSGSDGCKCSNITVKNCNFSNTAYGIVAFVRDFKIENNTFSNFKSTGWITDTASQADIGADPMLLSGSKYRITNNRITGSWAYANPFNSSSSGLLGGAVETINNFDSSFIAYNTFIDCSGGMEFGTNLPGGIQGPDDDTICYNKFINCSNIAYVNTTGTYATQVKNLHFWNNFFVEGSMSRFSGNNAGGDAMGDGQTYANTGFIYWPPYPINKSTRYPSSENFQNAWRPIASGDHSVQAADTVFDIRNNVFWINNGFYAKYTQSERPKAFYRNNIYHLVSGYQGAVGSFTPTSLGPNTTLAIGERIINGKLIVDSSSIYPQNWDMHIASDTSYAINNGTNVGLNRDFEGNIVGATPSIGIYQYNSVAPTPCIFTYGTWTTCNNGVQTRPYVTSPTGCVGFPPTDSIQRSCTSPIVPCNFTYGIWTTCANGTQTRTYTSTPVGCTGVPPADSVQRACVSPTPCVFTYSQWSTCINGLQSRTYTSEPIGCIGLPSTDSLSRSCSSVNIRRFFYNSDRRSIYINSNTSGTMVIKNILGVTVKTSSYSSGGDWVSVRNLTSGSYVAITYNQSILFVKQ